MKIEPISNGNLRLWLAEEEMEEWGLAEEHGGGDGIRRLVRRALTATGRRTCAKVWAEMIPVDGGCVVLVSTAVHNDCRPAVYAVDADALVEIYLRRHPLPGEKTAPLMRLYTVEGAYRLVVYSDTPPTEGRVALLSEYGCLLGRGEELVAHLAEYGEPAGELTADAPAPPDRPDRRSETERCP